MHGDNNPSAVALHEKGGERVDGVFFRGDVGEDGEEGAVGAVGHPGLGPV